MIHGKGLYIGRGEKSCLSESWRLILELREEVIPIGQKKNQEVELTDLEEVRKRVKRIKKRKKGFYKKAHKSIEQKEVS